MVQHKKLFEITKAESEMHLVEAEARLDDRLTDTTAQRDHLCEVIDRLSSDLGTLTVKHNMTHCQSSAIIIEVGTVSRQN